MFEKLKSDSKKIAQSITKKKVYGVAQKVHYASEQRRHETEKVYGLKRKTRQLDPKVIGIKPKAKKKRPQYKFIKLQI